MGVLEDAAVLLEGTAIADELIAVTELGLIEDAAGAVELGCGVAELPPPPPPHPNRESNKLDNSRLFFKVMAILFIVVSKYRLRTAGDAAAQGIQTREFCYKPVGSVNAYAKKGINW